MGKGSNRTLRGSNRRSSATRMVVCTAPVVRRTKAPRRLVVKFVDEFTAANHFVATLIRREVKRHPYRNYFS